MWQVNCNYKRDNTDTKCPLCKKSEDNTEHVLECGKAKKFALTKENSKGEWKEITEIYRKNKKKRERAVIKVQGQHKIIKENGKNSKIRKIKEKEKSGKISRKGRRKTESLKIQKRRTRDKNDNNNNKKTRMRKKIKRRVRGI